MASGYDGHYKYKEAARQKAFSSIWEDRLDDVFSEIYKSYDHANTYASLFLWDRLRHNLINTVELKSGYRVLDVCAGTNAVGIDLLGKQPDVEVTALEKNEPMMGLGTDKAVRQGLVIEPVIGDAHDLPFPDNYFDVVTIQWSTRHLRMVEVLTEVKRVLKSGGCFYCQDLMRPRNYFIEVAYRWFLKVSVWFVSTIFSVGPASLGCRNYFTEAIRLFYSVGEYAELLQEMGFVDVNEKSYLLGTVGVHKGCKP